MFLSFPEKQLITARADDIVRKVSDNNTCDDGYVLSSEVSNSWRIKNDPEFKKYLEGGNASSISSRAFGVTTPTVPSKMSGYKKYNVVDVSEFQAWHDPIDWEALKKQGITGAIIRAGYRGYGTEGTIVKDQYFDQNVQGALDAGLNVGVYFYTQAISVAEAREEADYVAKWIGNYYITLPVYFDIEHVDYDVGRLDAANLSKSQQTALCTAFCDRMQANKLYAGVYASKYYFYDELNYTELQSKYEIWLAHYSTTTDYAGSFDAWQYSSSGVVTGIYDYVDLDLWFATTPSKISSVKAVKSGTNLTLSWDRPKGAYAFYIEKYDAASKSYKQLATIKSCTYTLKNVSNNDKYRVVPYKRMGNEVFRATAYEIYGNGSQTPSVPVTDPTNIPDVSINSKTIYPNEISVTFKKQNVSGYRLYISKNKDMTDSTYVQGSSNIQSIKGLRPDTTYYFKAYMYQISNGKAYWSKPITFSQKTVDLDSPKLNTNLTTSSSTSIKFNLNAVPRAEGYRIWLYDNSSLTNGRMIDGKTTITFSGLTANKSYYVRAYAYLMVDGEKYFSDPTTFTYKTLSSDTPETVTNFKASVASKNSVKLTWTKVSDAQGYIVYKYDPSKKNYVRVEKTAANSNSYTVSGLSEGTSYTFAVKAYKTINGKEIVSQSFPTASAVTPLSTVTNFKASAASKNSVKLTWTKVSDAQGYIVYKYDPSKKNYVRVEKTAANSNSYTVSGLSEGTSYTFAVKAYKTINGKEIVSQSFPTASAVTPLSTVKSIKATSAKTSLKLNWGKVSGAQGYIIYKYDASKKNYVRVIKTTNTTTSYTITGLRANTSYTVTVKAYKTVIGKEIVSESFIPLKAKTSK